MASVTVQDILIRRIEIVLYFLCEGGSEVRRVPQIIRQSTFSVGADGCRNLCWVRCSNFSRRWWSLATISSHGLLRAFETVYAM